MYDTLVSVHEFWPEEVCYNDYVIEEINGTWYQIEYQSEAASKSLLYMNLIFFVMLLVTVAVVAYIYKKVLKPFHSMCQLSCELAQGNLSVPVKEEKSRLFGKFLWGMDMLREKLEENRCKELELQREKKTLILSLSHDIKTPLSSIELYAKALETDLYETKEQKEKALQGIKQNVKEIKGYVDEIVTASREDFLNLEVVPGEFYLTEVIDAIEHYYQERLSVLHTELVLETFTECMVQGDKNRLIEVLQNIMENAIKYGDGKKIHVYGTEEEDCKLIHIENTGSQLKEEEMPNIFDSFYRGSNSLGKKGNGLGLYICKTLMRKMDGEIFAEVKEHCFRVSVVVRKV